MAIDLTTHYGSLKLRSSLVVGACPLISEEQTRLAIESAGAGAIVLPSLFEEQVILWNERGGHAVTQRDQQLLERSCASTVFVQRCRWPRAGALVVPAM